MVKKFLVGLTAIVLPIYSSALTLILDGETIELQRLVIEQDGRVIATRRSEPPPGNDQPPPGNDQPPPGNDQPPPGNDCPPTQGLNVIHRTFNLQNGDAFLRTILKRNDALAIRITTDVNPNIIRQISVGNHGATPSHKLVTISKCPGDFTSTNIPNRCVASGGETSLPFVLETSSLAGRFCTLEPGQNYFINVRNATREEPNRDTCPTGRECGVVIYVR